MSDEISRTTGSGAAMNTWTTEYRRDIAAPPQRIWQIFTDVEGWKAWNAGIESIAIDGPFATGTWFTMKPPGQEALHSCLIEVRENECFVDQTRVGDLEVVVTHRIERLSSTTSRVSYAVEATGPAAAEVGPMVSADFPDVLAALARVAESTDASTRAYHTR